MRNNPPWKFGGKNIFPEGVIFTFSNLEKLPFQKIYSPVAILLSFCIQQTYNVQKSCLLLNFLDAYVFLVFLAICDNLFSEFQVSIYSVFPRKFLGGHCTLIVFLIAVNAPIQFLYSCKWTLPILGLLNFPVLLFQLTNFPNKVRGKSGNLQSVTRKKNINF